MAPDSPDAKKARVDTDEGEDINEDEWVNDPAVKATLEAAKEAQAALNKVGPRGRRARGGRGRRERAGAGGAQPRAKPKRLWSGPPRAAVESGAAAPSPSATPPPPPPAPRPRSTTRRARRYCWWSSATTSSGSRPTSSGGTRCSRCGAQRGAAGAGGGPHQRPRPPGDHRRLPVCPRLTPAPASPCRPQVPGFWRHALLGHPNLAEFFTSDDLSALEALKRVGCATAGGSISHRRAGAAGKGSEQGAWCPASQRSRPLPQHAPPSLNQLDVVDAPDIKSGFTVTFTFDPEANKYFSNEVRGGTGEGEGGGGEQGAGWTQRPTSTSARWVAGGGGRTPGGKGPGVGTS
jgi:hypothetical protein